MKCLVIALITLISGIHCRSLLPSKLKDIKENEIFADKQRSVRVHRVSDYASSPIANHNVEPFTPKNLRSAETIDEQYSNHLDEWKDLIVSEASKLEKLLLADVESQVKRIRNNFEKVCRKHLTVTWTPQTEHSENHLFANQPMKVSIL